MFLKKASLLLIVISLCFHFGFAGVTGWRTPVLVVGNDGIVYEKPIVKVGPNGMVYCLYRYEGGPNLVGEIHLQTWDGKQFGVLEDVNVSDNSLETKAYEGDIYVTDNGNVHVAWTEFVRGDSWTNYIKYRFWNGSVWSPIYTLATLHVDYTEDLRVAADNNGNVAVTTMHWPSAVCILCTKYGDQIGIEEFPGEGRFKHPDCDMDENFIHVVFQYDSGNGYVAQHAVRANTPNGQWLLSEQMSYNGIEFGRPRICLDEYNSPHMTYWEEGDMAGFGRQLWYVGSVNNDWDDAICLTGEDEYPLFHWADIAVKNKVVAATCVLGQSQSGESIYHMRIDSNGHQNLPDVVPGGIAPFLQSVALTDDGVSVIFYASERSALYLITNGEVSANGTLKAQFSHDTNIFWNSATSFNASASINLNPDHTITNYRWDFGDGTVVDTTSPTTTHTFTIYNITTSVKLTITASNGATGSTTVQIPIHAIYNGIPTSITQKRIRTLFYNRLANLIEWAPNQKNITAGFPEIVSYEIWRTVDTGIIGNSVYELLGEVEASAPLRFLDFQNVQDNVHYLYSIVSVDSAGHKSPYNNQ